MKIEKSWVLEPNPENKEAVLKVLQEGGTITHSQFGGGIILLDREGKSITEFKPEINTFLNLLYEEQITESSRMTQGHDFFRGPVTSYRLRPQEEKKD